MDDELQTDPELLWPLLLTQIVYDVLSTGKLDFTAVSTRYKQHPLLPYNAPVLETAKDAEGVYNALYAENEIPSMDDERLRTQHLAEKLYVRYLENLGEKMSEEAQEFMKTYRQYEVEANVPKEERISEE